MVAQEKKRSGSSNAGRKNKSQNKPDVDNLWDLLWMMLVLIKKYDRTKDDPAADTFKFVTGFERLGLYEGVVQSYFLSKQAQDSIAALLRPVTAIYRRVCAGEIKGPEYREGLTKILEGRSHFGLPHRTLETLHISKEIIQSDLYRGPKGAAEILLYKLFYGTQPRTAAKHFDSERLSEGLGQDALKDFLQHSFPAEKVDAALASLFEAP
jgi:hypothetical protein